MVQLKRRLIASWDEIIPLCQLRFRTRPSTSIELDCFQPYKKTNREPLGIFGQKCLKRKIFLGGDMWVHLPFILLYIPTCSLLFRKIIQSRRPSANNQLARLLFKSDLRWQRCSKKLQSKWGPYRWDPCFILRCSYGYWIVSIIYLVVAFVFSLVI